MGGDDLRQVMSRNFDPCFGLERAKIHHPCTSFLFPHLPVTSRNQKQNWITGLYRVSV